MTRTSDQHQSFDAALARGREALAGAGPWESAEPNVKRFGTEDPEMTEERRKKLTESLIEQFRNPETAGIDWDLLRDGKLRAWPIPRFHR